MILRCYYVFYWWICCFIFAFCHSFVPRIFRAQAHTLTRSATLLQSLLNSLENWDLLLCDTHFGLRVPSLKAPSTMYTRCSMLPCGYSVVVNNNTRQKITFCTQSSTLCTLYRVGERESRCCSSRLSAVVENAFLMTAEDAKIWKKLEFIQTFSYPHSDVVVYLRILIFFRIERQYCTLFRISISW